MIPERWVRDQRVRGFKTGCEKMNAKELISELQSMPPDAEVVSARDIEGAWTVLSKPTLTKYRELKICVLKEGY